MSQDLYPSELCLYLDKRLIPNFFYLLQQGFVVKVQAGSSIKTFLCEQLGLSPEYIEKRIQTLFMDGRPVDDIDSAIVKDGSTLALSAAMPGLVGAILRKGGYYTSMRSTISYREEREFEPPREATVSLKLFNILLREIGPTFLKKGLWIQGKDLADFLKRQSDDFWAGCKKAHLDGETLDLNRLSGNEWADRQVFLQLRAY